jgi:hypothetical protein
MRRIILLVVVAVVLTALAVSPAFAQNDDCQGDEQGELCYYSTIPGQPTMLKDQ